MPGIKAIDNMPNKNSQLFSKETKNIVIFSSSFSLLKAQVSKEFINSGKLMDLFHSITPEFKIINKNVDKRTKMIGVELIGKIFME